MNNRKQRGEIRGIRSHYGRPPPGSWQPTIPSWEKKFCYTVGSIPWGKLLEAKKFMYLHENIVQWNDSAAEEAFHNAKNRFLAKINGLSCNISLPDPDIYIDKIDWNSNIDPELLLDLERSPRDFDDRDKGEEVVILGTSCLFNQSFSCNGWGEAEEELQKVPKSVSDLGYKCFVQDFGNVNPWETKNTRTNLAMKDDGWGHHWRGNSYNEWNNSYKERRNDNDGNGEAWGAWDENNRKRESASWHVSRYKISRFRGDDYQMDRRWSGRGRRRVNYVC